MRRRRAATAPRRRTTNRSWHRAISDIRATSPSLCAVADSSTIHLDRRLAATDTLESAVKEIQDLPSVKNAEAEVVVLDYAVPSWKGLTYPTKKYFPTWLLPEDHPVLGTGVKTYESLFGEKPVVGQMGIQYQRSCGNGNARYSLHRVRTG